MADYLQRLSIRVDTLLQKFADRLDTSPLLLIPDRRRQQKRKRRAAAAAVLMEAAFNLDELEELAVELGLEWEDIKGETKKEKIRSMVGYYYRINLLDVFIGNLEAERPNYKWPKEEANGKD